MSRLGRSTLPLSYTRPNRIYFSPKNGSCKGGVLASSKTEEKAPTELGALLKGTFYVPEVRARVRIQLTSLPIA